MDVINTVGALAGVGAFVGVSVLAVLYFSQARDVRRLRDWAGRAPERAAQAEQALVAYEAGTAAPQAQPQTATEHQGDVAEQPAAAPAAVGAPMAPQGAPPQQPPQTREDWQIEAEAAADAELEQRRQQREQFGGYTTHKRGGLPEVNSPWIVLVGGAILIFAVIFGAIHVLGGGDGTETTSKGKKKGGGSPEVVKVAVLNGTAVPGLAAKVGDDVTSSGFKLGAVTNSESSFDTTIVMYKQGSRPEAVKVAKSLGVDDVRVMTAEIEGVAKGAPVAVVVGQDRVPSSATPGVTTTTTPVTPAPTPVTPTVP